MSVDKKFIDSADQILVRLKTDLADFIEKRREFMASLEHLKIYYDCGQSPVTHMLHEVFENGLGRDVEFANNVKPSRYRMFQLADLICTLHLIELKLRAGVKLSKSENQFFGGPRMFHHNILRYIKAKEL